MTTGAGMEEKYGIVEQGTGGGCYHGCYTLKATDDIYWLINHCDANGDPDLKMVTDDNHQRTMFGLQFYDSDAHEICTSIFGAFTKQIDRHIGDVDAVFVTDFQTGHEMMVAISNAIQSQLDSNRNPYIKRGQS